MDATTRGMAAGLAVIMAAGAWWMLANYGLDDAAQRFTTAGLAAFSVVFAATVFLPSQP